MPFVEALGFFQWVWEETSLERDQTVFRIRYSMTTTLMRNDVIATGRRMTRRRPTSLPHIIRREAVLQPRKEDPCSEAGSFPAQHFDDMCFCLRGRHSRTHWQQRAVFTASSTIEDLFETHLGAERFSCLCPDRDWQHSSQHNGINTILRTPRRAPTSRPLHRRARRFENFYSQERRSLFAADTEPNLQKKNQQVASDEKAQHQTRIKL